MTTTTLPITEPGVYPGLSFAEYLAIDAVNFSTLKALAGGDRAYVHSLSHVFEGTDATNQGDLLHTLILEPAELLMRFAVWEGGRRAGKDYDQFCESNDGKTLVRKQELDEAKAWADLLFNDSVTGPEVRAITARELAVVWQDEQTGLLIKNRIDADSGAKLSDLKTTCHREPDLFYRDATNRYYPAQFAMYVDGFEAATGELRPFQVIGLYKGDKAGQWPIDCWVSDISESVLEHGRWLYRDWLRRAARIGLLTENLTGIARGQRLEYTIQTWAESQLPGPDIQFDDDATVF